MKSSCAGDDKVVGGASLIEALFGGQEPVGGREDLDTRRRKTSSS